MIESEVEWQMCIVNVEEKVFKGYDITKKEAVLLCNNKQVDRYLSWVALWYAKWDVIVKLSDGKCYKIEYIEPADGGEDGNSVYSPKVIEVQKEYNEITKWSEV